MPPSCDHRVPLIDATLPRCSDSAVGVHVRHDIQVCLPAYGPELRKADGAVEDNYSAIETMRIEVVIEHEAVRMTPTSSLAPENEGARLSPPVATSCQFHSCALPGASPHRELMLRGDECRDSGVN